MKFAEALGICQAQSPAAGRPYAVTLACGCTAHHLQIFLKAHLCQLLPERSVVVTPGLYGDCLGTLERVGQQPADGVAALIEWSDLDPRLGIRQTGGWSPVQLPDILASVEAQANRFAAALMRAAGHAAVAVALPTLPLPPVACTPGWQLSPFETHLRIEVLNLAARIGETPGLRIVNTQRLDQLSPPADRHDAKGELLSGSPYRMPHVSALAGQLAQLLHAPVPKKGLITDLDDTLWRGILGEVGPDGISWSLDRHSQAHALYQQMLQALADAGVLVAVASKNDPARVAEAFKRSDLLLRPDRIFPVEAHWGPKSESVGRILRAWNVAAGSVVFVDDSALEIAEVQTAHPGIEAIAFPTGQDQAIIELLGKLRERFGKQAVRAEDRLRLDSLRASAAVAQPAGHASQDDFLRGLDAELTLEAEGSMGDPRGLELVNKTNQFNLNGRRFAEAEWQALLHRPGWFSRIVSYRDRFGPLGKIAVLAGWQDGERLVVDVWVQSCRAFARRIEHRCLQALFDDFAVPEVAFAFEATPRNGPLQDFLAELTGTPPAGTVRLSRRQFFEKCPPLFHRIEEMAHG